MTYCPACDRDVTPRVVEKVESYPVRSEAVEVNAKVAECPTCGTEMFDEQLDAANLSDAYCLYRKSHGLLSPGEIKALRKSYGLSQKAFSLLLGWGEITVHRYEAGSLQSVGHEALLRLVESPENMRKLLEVNPDALTLRQRRTLEDRLSTMSAAEISCEEFRRYDIPLVAEPSLLNGYRVQDMAKVRAMVAYFASIPDMFVTKLAKMLFYADFVHFKRYTTSISGLTYCHLPYGPVPDKYDRIRGDVIEASVVEYVERAGADWGGQVVVPGANSSIDALTEDELTVMHLVAAALGDKSSQALSSMSHAETAYQETEMGQPISYAHADRLSIPSV